MIPKVSGWSTPEARYQRKQARKATKAKATKAADAKARAADREVRFWCYLRDHKRCRAFGTPLLFDTDNPAKRSENHHIIYRSAGGSDAPSNRITLSLKAHRMEHDGLLDIAGDGNTTVTFREFEYRSGTRTFVREWSSTV